MLNVDIRTLNTGHIPFRDFSLLSIFNLTNLSPADVDLSSSDPKSADEFSISWFDGTSAPGDFIFYDLKEKLLLEEPRISNLSREVSTSEAVRLFRKPHLITSKEGQEFFNLADSIGGNYLIGSLGVPPECKVIKENVIKTLGL